MPVKSTRRMTESPDPLKVEESFSPFQTRDLLAGPESPEGAEGDTTDKEEEGSGSGDVDSTDADQYYDQRLDSYDPGEGENGEARKFWKKLPADTRRELAHQELGNLETNKQFQLYLQALSNYENSLPDTLSEYFDIFSVLEAKNMYQKNYLEFM